MTISSFIDMIWFSFKYLWCFENFVKPWMPLLVKEWLNWGSGSSEIAPRQNHKGDLK